MSQFYSLPNIPITEWSVSDRPREKYLAHGSLHIGDAELLAILLRTGTSQESAVDLAKRLLAANDNSLNKVADLSVSELTKIKGIGTVKAVTLHAAFELSRRLRSEKVEVKRRISTPDDIVELMQSRLADLKHEQFWVVFVNQGSGILQIECISSGGITRTTVDIRQIMRRALELGATGLFLCHNHPSGNLKPSQEDISLTLQIQKTAQYFDIRVCDHVIIYKNEGFSFHGEGLLHE